MSAAKGGVVRTVSTRIVTLAGLLLAGCAPEPVAPVVSDPVVAVRAVRVAAAPVELAITAAGTLAPEARVLVAAQQEGLVTAGRARAGGGGGAGQVLVELDDRELRAQLAEAEAGRGEAAAQWQRAATLVASGLVSSAAVDTAKAALASAAARVEVLTTRLSFARIAAPVAGVVTARHVEVGNLASARTPLLELAAGSSLVLRVPVSELDVVHLAAGDVATVSVDALPGLEVASRIARIFPAADAASRQVTVELVLEAVPATVRPGFLARARLVTGRLPEALTVPETAVLRGSDVPFFVYLASGGRAVVRSVTVGERLGGQAVISHGLSVGDEVVVEGMARLRDGAAIAVAAPEPAS